MNAIDDHNPEMIDLMARADKAIARSRELMASIRVQRDQALQQLEHMYRIGAEMGGAASVRHPGDTADARLSNGIRRNGGSTSEQV